MVGAEVYSFREKDDGARHRKSDAEQDEGNMKSLEYGTT
jgi:hypothetical protein